MSAAYTPDTGHVIKIDMDPAAGHEQAGWRPALVLSPAGYNARSNLVVAVPITAHVKGYTFEVHLPTQMKTSGVILADQIKSLDWRARRARFVEISPIEVLKAVHERIGLLLGLAR